MRIGYATEDWGRADDGRFVPGGSAWWRVLTPAKWLREQGHDVIVGRVVGRKQDDRLGIAPWSDGGHDLARSIFDVDVVILHRCMEHRLPDAIDAARDAGQTVVNDVDDWYFGLRPSNSAWHATHPTVSEDENVNHYRQVLAAGDVIMCSTPYLADRLDNLAPTTVVRNAIDPTPWATIADHRARYREANPPGTAPVLGWVGATPWRSGDLQTMKGLLDRWLSRNGWAWYHGGHLDGAPSAAEQAGIGDTVEQFTEPFRTVDEYPALFLPVDVGIVPLSDIPFNHAKSAVKGMEYAAAGIPFIAADTPEYVWLHREHGVGRIASKPREWTRHLDELTDPDVREAEGAANRAAVKALTIEQRGPSWIGAIERAARG